MKNAISGRPGETASGHQAEAGNARVQGEPTGPLPPAHVERLRITRGHVHDTLELSMTHSPHVVAFRYE